MRRIVIWSASTLGALLVLLSYSTSTGRAATHISSPAVAGAVPAAGATTGSAGSSGAGTTYTGDVMSTQWGPVQVQITVSGGRVTSADAVQVPTGNPRDEQINGYAVPVYESETVTAQSADIDAVSGATVTWQGYTGSLQSALDEAGL
ncbi:FMN-binding protein [Janibacter melonis]|uniref:FMN-binding protein n=1 Tax=Janibacter melonis TaxID=262209 RepID=A0A5P8FMJ1_9MICO|nr:FMN-binding protein [Janibacter melonis]QFQ29972.1 FMN-binding protein [Janibacter melonis]